MRIIRARAYNGRTRTASVRQTRAVNRDEVRGPFSSDLQDHQHAGPLVRGWSDLAGLSGARVQDPRLPVVQIFGILEIYLYLLNHNVFKLL